MANKRIDQRQLALAIDVGGTFIKAGLITRTGELKAIRRIATPAQAAPEFVAGKMFDVAGDLCRSAGVAWDNVDGVGISIAAFITAGGVISATAHLSHEWIGYNLRDRLFRQSPAEYYFALDVPAPTIGEAYYGAGKGVDHFVYVTISTGIGAGIMARGKYVTGGFGWAGGIGHTIIDERSSRICEGCGNAGCLETFAAKQGIVATARELAAESPDTLMLKLVDVDPGRLSPQIVCEAARQGDPAAEEVFRRAGHALGIGLTNLADIVSPKRIVIGGGIAQAGDLLLEPARAVVRQRAFPPAIRRVEIVQAELGDLSGIYGAATMVFHDLRVNFDDEMANP